MEFYVLCLSQTQSSRQWALWKALAINWYAEPFPTNPKSLPPWVPGEEETVLLWWFENQILKVINKFLVQVFPVTNQKDNKEIQFKSSAVNHANTTAAHNKIQSVCITMYYFIKLLQIHMGLWTYYPALNKAQCHSTHLNCPPFVCMYLLKTKCHLPTWHFQSSLFSLVLNLWFSPFCMSTAFVLMSTVCLHWHFDSRNKVVGYFLLWQKYS